MIIHRSEPHRSIGTDCSIVNAVIRKFSLNKLDKLESAFVGPKLINALCEADEKLAGARGVNPSDLAGGLPGTVIFRPEINPVNCTRSDVNAPQAAMSMVPDRTFAELSLKREKVLAGR
jgi:hypothetical protein